MAQSLQVNDKDYLPSSELAKKFDYTSDYISKLARDEKILGTRVGRQWFIEPESLRTYIQQLEVEKQINKEALSRQRKLERQIPAEESAEGSVPERSHGSLIAVGQALAVLVCGGLIGVMSLSVYSNGLRSNDLVAGVWEVASQFSKPLSQGFQSVKNIDAPSSELIGDTLSDVSDPELVYVAFGPQFQTDGVYTTFPDLSGEASSSSLAFDDKPRVSGAQASDERVEVMEFPFSDDVIANEVDGGVFVRPVFKDSLGNLFELSAVPVTSDGKDQLR